jgi:tRNA 5-methylaminomethyl-2-thiouridine biosynthesis bifunctional protein
MSPLSVSSFQALVPAALAFDDHGRLYSNHHDDVYHGGLDPWLRARRIYLEGNAIPARWAGKPRFTVLETGFGAGINFLALWDAWRNDPARPRRLHVVALEEHPFGSEALTALFDGIVAPELRRLADALAASFPPMLPGLHRMDFELGAVTLTLGFGCVERLACEVRASVDAFFFGGFAPRRDPAAWSLKSIGALAALAADGATAASALADDDVMRALSAGGFSARRHDAQALRPAFITATAGRPTAPGARSAASALIVGGGLAGAGVARALAGRGIDVTVIDSLPGSGAGAPHAGHMSAALTPLISRDDDARARLSRAGSQRARIRWAEFGDQGVARHCGTLQMARDAERAAKMQETLSALGFPPAWVRYMDAGEASKEAGIAVPRGGLFFRDGMQVRPAPLIEHLLNHPLVRRIQGGVASLRQGQHGWDAIGAGGVVLAGAEGVVLANSVTAPALLAASGLGSGLSRLAQLHGLAGEVTHLQQSALSVSGGSRCILSGEGYLLPSMHGFCVAGSTYVHGATEACVGIAGQRVNIAKAAALLGRDAADFALGEGVLPGWAGWRAVMPGRLPCIGVVSDTEGLWLASGYASRGLSWSALGGDLIAAQWCREPWPLEISLAAAIAPR